MIAYKVVEKGTRISSNFAMHKALCRIKNLKSLSYVTPKISRFCKRYCDNTVVKAEPNTPGILCFKDLASAKSFKRCHRTLDDCIIIKVTGKNQNKNLFYISSGCGHDPTYLIRKSGSPSLPPYGTIAFEEVYVNGRVKE